MTRPRPPKKTESLEVRLPHAVKHALMAKARGQGRTASAVIRELVDSYLADDPDREESRPMFKRLTKPAAVTSLAASVLVLYAVTPAAVSAAPDLKAMFEALDRNKDGAVSLDEFAHRNGDLLFVRREMPETEHHKPFVLPLSKHHAELHKGDTASPESVTMLRAHFSRQDGDRDGRVSFAEFEAYHVSIMRQGFDAIDTDHDGAIEPEEYGRATLRLPRPADPKAPSFEGVDRNGDGRISFEEFVA